MKQQTLSITERTEWATSISRDLQAKGFRTEIASNGLSVLVSSYRNDVLMAIKEMPENWVQWNMANTRGANDEFKTIVKPS